MGWLPGIVCDIKVASSSPGACNEPISYSVLYEHAPDMVESGVLPEALRARVPGDAKATYALNERVMGREKGGSHWLFGTVKARHAPGARSYCISFGGIGSQAIVKPLAMRPFG